MQRLNPRIHINELHVPQETEPPGCFRSANELKVSRPRQLESEPVWTHSVCWCVMCNMSQELLVCAVRVEMLQGDLL